jgi:hypothetical protein
MRGRSGLSSSMQVGNIASLALDSSIAMRIRFQGEVPKRSELYVRGPVLSTFDGREWKPLRTAFAPSMQPQTNLRVAYQYSADTAIALNLDHMKYVMVQDVSAPISGQINGVAQSGQQLLTDNWMTYEHTDGLNIISLELEKQRPVDWFGANHKSKVFGLAGFGIALPKSNVKMGMINQQRNDEFHLAGYSLSAGAGLEVDVWRDLFVRGTYKFGYVDLPDVLTSSRGDKASQHFTFNELIFTLGWRF